VVRQGASFRSPAFHVGNTSSNPVGDARYLTAKRLTPSQCGKSKLAIELHLEHGTFSIKSEIARVGMDLDLQDTPDGSAHRACHIGLGPGLNIVHAQPICSASSRRWRFAA